jgi:hypothetical protein
MYRTKDYPEDARGVESCLGCASPDKTGVSGSSPEWPTMSVR